MVKNFHGTQAWKNKRAAILRRDKYLDQLLLREGIHQEATMVHHIFPVDNYPEYSLKDWNLISISKETHRELHDPLGNLSPLGKMLQQETAERQGIPLSMVILVCGLSGSGKTTWASAHLGNGLAYDLDYIAGAFRLSRPKMNDIPAARKMANSMLTAFVANARQRVGRVVVIRTAPPIDEVERVNPDAVVICEGGVDKGGQAESLNDLRQWAELNGVPLSIVPPVIEPKAARP